MKNMSFEYSQEIINDYEKLLEIDKGHDVIIYAGEDENLKEIHAHSIILRIRSHYFYETFSNECLKKDGNFILKKPNISPKIFKIILRFIYCGKIDLTKLQGQELLDLLMAVDELSIQMLIPCIQEYLVDYQYEFLQQSPIEILETIYNNICQHDAFKELLDVFLETICEKPDILFNSDKLIKLKAPLLELLLKRDDLLLDEIEIWNNLIKWSFAQHPSILQDVEKWNKEEITIMKSILHKFIPLIRFVHISTEDFHLKVYPLKVLLPENLINDILTFHTAPIKKLINDVQPPRNPKYDTLIIIRPQNFAIFSSWIEKKTDSYYNLRDIPYYFKLIYRASRDGYTAKEFHEKCDYKGATIVVIKIEGSEQIVGGYNPFDWSGDNYKTTKESFIFSFTNRRNTKTAKMGYSNGLMSIGCYHDYGPIFGGYFYSQNDGTSWKINDSNYLISYSGIGIQTGDVNVDDYEVFQVTKKP